jgi:hypothetical protein|tara:strand:+ start:4740 stop:5309 length:570 start_codon:yes stop_codon:yes gene_type:complete
MDNDEKNILCIYSDKYFLCSEYIRINKMSHTRYHDDEVRITKQLEEMTYAGRYQLDTPGQGSVMPFQEDTHLRLQQFGANLQTNSIQLESDLMGLTRPLQRDNIETNNYVANQVETKEITFPNAQPFVEESRASHPAWMYRDLEHPIWETPILNPQANLEKPFHDNIQTRTLEKDNYRPNLIPTDRSGK